MIFARRSSIRFFNSSQQSSIQGIFESRDLFYQSTSPQLANTQFLGQVANKSVYCGYDPTSDSLHLGNLVSIIMMSRLSLLGMKPLFLVGGATGLIGDPSGKIKQRTLLDQKIVQSNIQSLKSQISSTYNNIQTELTKNVAQYKINSQQLQRSINFGFKLVNNYEFYKNMDAVRYLRDVGKYFRMSTLLGRETVANRLKSEDGISYAEFSYSIIQAYDFYRLNQEEGCVLQFGGSDQWGNIANGCDLIRKKTGKQAYGITMPLLLTKTGQKFGKSEGNALFLNPQKTSSETIYNYFFNCSDQDVQRYLRIFTFYSEQKIQEIVSTHNENKDKKVAQKILGQSVLRLIRTKQQNASKNRQFFTLSHQEILKRDHSFFKELFSRMHKDNNQYYQISKEQIKQYETIADLMAKKQMAKSKGQIRRQVQKGGLYSNNRRISIQQLSNPCGQFLKQNLLFDQFLLLRWGKKRYQFVHIK